MALPIELRHHQMLSSIEIKAIRRVQKRRGYTINQEKNVANKHAPDSLARSSASTSSNSFGNYCL